MYMMMNLSLMLTVFTAQQSLADVDINNLSSSLPSQPNPADSTPPAGYNSFPPLPSNDDIGYENLLKSQPQLPKQYIPHDAAIKTKAEAFQGKTLLNPKVAELPDFVDAGGTANNLLTVGGIFKILQASGKIKQGFSVSEGLSRNVNLGAAFSTQFGKITRLPTGFYSEQIYKITLNPAAAVDALPSSFIVKCVKWVGAKTVKNRQRQTPIKEIQDLKRVEQIILPKVIQLKEKDPLFPTLAVPEHTFYYFDADHLKQYVAVLPLSSGRSVQSLMNDSFLLGDIQGFDEMIKKVGRALGAFHYRLAPPEEQQKLSSGALPYKDFKTHIHGDFHNGNVFFDEDGVTFIDNASIADSIINLKNPLADIYRFYTFMYGYGIFSLSPQQYHDLENSFMSFTEGYVAAFPAHIQESIKRSLVAAFEDMHRSIKNQFGEYLAGKRVNLPPIATDDPDLKLFRYFIFNYIKSYLNAGNTKESLVNKFFYNPDQVDPPVQNIIPSSEPTGRYID